MEFNSLNARFLSKLGHRSTFSTALVEMAQTMSNLVVMTADLTTLTGLTNFKNKYPKQFYNLGIAEQNMIGVAAGMAKDGFVVFTTTYANFITMRSYEQIRMNLGYQKFNVKVVGTGGGISMGMSGNSHYGIEDMAIMRAIPNIVILSPADGFEIVKATFAAANFDGPIYLRLTGALNSPIIYKDDYSFEIGRAIKLREGSDITIIATGTMVYESIEAAKLLAEQGIESSVVNMHTIKPLDTSVIDKALNSKLIVTVEEHSIVGGLGGAVAEYKSTLKSSPPQLFIGLPDSFVKIGDYKYLLEQHGLTSKQIAHKIIEQLERKTCMIF